MNQDFIENYKEKLKPGSSQRKVFELLSDQDWHCRTCEGKQVASEQYAGGGGIQGLQRGNRGNRPGLEIQKERRRCPTCRKTTTCDRWTGEVKNANAPANIPAQLVSRILKLYRYTDAIEQRQRESHELVIDHRFPMERWGSSEPSHDVNMSDREIRGKFQLLKKDMNGNHNLLKSRSCEKCIKTGERGAPLGIKFWYFGKENWPDDIPQRGADAEQGCVGCGWYDFESWRTALNSNIKA